MLKAEGYDVNDTAISNEISEQDIIPNVTPVAFAVLLPIEKDVIALINEVRVDPKRFKKKYLANLPGIKKDRYYRSLLTTLDSMKPMAPLKDSKYLNATAQHHATDMGKHGIVGHFYSDRKMITDVFDVAECCDYGNTTAIDIVRSLLIDQGVKSLGHRKELLLREATFIGVSYKKHHSVYKYCMVLHFK